jgi:hypothetical protein
VSAVLALDFLEVSQSWTFKNLRPVDYDLRDSWLSEKHSDPFAVVDFLYHPDAQFWADHHQTSFLTPSLKHNCEEQKNPFHIYSARSGSCAMLLWRVLRQCFNYRNTRYAELVKWADKIDAARYSSVEEAISGSHAALNIHRTLAITKDPDYLVWLVTTLRRNALEHVGYLPEVVEKSNEAQRLIKAGLERLSKTVHLKKNGVAVFDVDSSDVLVNRYAPYYFFPSARYSLGTVRTSEGIKITAMRNPWREFPSIYLGKLFERLGGGGHRRVGSLMLRGSKARDAERIMKRLLHEICKEDASNNKSAPA